MMKKLIIKCCYFFKIITCTLESDSFNKIILFLNEEVNEYDLGFKIKKIEMFVQEKKEIEKLNIFNRFYRMYSFYFHDSGGIINRGQNVMKKVEYNYENDRILLKWLNNKEVEIKGIKECYICNEGNICKGGNICNEGNICKDEFQLRNVNINDINFEELIISVNNNYKYWGGFFFNDKCEEKPKYAGNFLVKNIFNKRFSNLIGKILTNENHEGHEEYYENKNKDKVLNNEEYRTSETLDDKKYASDKILYGYISDISCDNISFDNILSNINKNEIYTFNTKIELYKENSFKNKSLDFKNTNPVGHIILEIKLKLSNCQKTEYKIESYQDIKDTEKEIDRAKKINMGGDEFYNCYIDIDLLFVKDLSLIQLFYLNTAITKYMSYLSKGNKGKCDECNSYNKNDECDINCDKGNFMTNEMKDDYVYALCSYLSYGIKIPDSVTHLNIFESDRSICIDICKSLNRLKDALFSVKNRNNLRINRMSDYKILNYTPAEQLIPGFIIIRVNKDTVIVAFKGTESINEAIVSTNLKYTKMGNSYIHSGAKEFLKNLLMKDWKIFEDLIKEYDNIILTGHSLGGSVATALHYLIKELKLDQRETKADKPKDDEIKTEDNFNIEENPNVKKIIDTSINSKIKPSIYSNNKCNITTVTFAPIPIFKFKEELNEEKSFKNIRNYIYNNDVTSYISNGTLKSNWLLIKNIINHNITYIPGYKVFKKDIPTLVKNMNEYDKEYLNYLKLDMLGKVYRLGLYNDEDGIDNNDDVNEEIVDNDEEKVDNNKEKVDKRYKNFVKYKEYLNQNEYVINLSEESLGNHKIINFIKALGRIKEGELEKVIKDKTDEFHTLQK